MIFSHAPAKVYTPIRHYIILNRKDEVNVLTFISVVPYNRELIVINDMDVFTSFFCYAKRQKKGLAPISRPAAATDETDGTDKSVYEEIADSEDKDLLPVTNIGFRY
jgi:hypothetical protein